MQQKILVPLDGSKVGEAALPVVKEMMSKLAPDMQKEVILLQVLQPVEATNLAVPPAEYAHVNVNEINKTEKERQEKEAREYLERVRQSIDVSGVSVVPEVVFGHAADEIVKTAEEAGADLIAMSTHGRSGIGRWVFGSITDKVLRHEESVPVMVVRAKKR